MPLRYRYGDTDPVKAVPSRTAGILVGDLLYQRDGEAWPASSLEPRRHAAFELPVLFTLNFLGIALESSPAGDADPIEVATRGVFECPAPFRRAWHLGDLVGSMLDLSLRLFNQTLTDVKENRLAIGRCAVAQEAGPTVHVAIVSSVMHGGIVGRLWSLP
jgi:hypothetical protein